MNIAKRHLLLVGLSHEVTMRIREAVGTHGTVYHDAPNQLEAMRLIDDLEPSVVVTAERFADGDGFILCEKIKKASRNRAIGVMLMTASTATFNHGKAMLAGIDQYLENQAPEDVLSEAVLELAEKMEKRQPLHTRRGNRLSDAPSEKSDTSELILSTEQYDSGQRATFYNIHPKTIQTATTEPTIGPDLYHGYGDEAPQPETMERDPLITHGIDSLEGTTGEAPKHGHNESYADPLEDFFANKEDAQAGALPKALAPNADFSFLEPKAGAPLTVETPVHDAVSRLGPQIAEVVTRSVEDWLESVMGRRVDGALRIEARQTLSALIVRTVDQAIRVTLKESK